MTSKPMSEKETRRHIIDHCRMNGYEQPALDIFKKVDEAMLNAKTQQERDLIALQGLQELDMLFKGGSSNLDGMTLGKNIDEEAIKKFINR